MLDFKLIHSAHFAFYCLLDFGVFLFVHIQVCWDLSHRLESIDSANNIFSLSLKHIPINASHYSFKLLQSSCIGNLGAFID